jgi:hypothetical protein
MTNFFCIALKWRGTDIRVWCLGRKFCHIGLNFMNLLLWSAPKTSLNQMKDTTKWQHLNLKLVEIYKLIPHLLWHHRLDTFVLFYTERTAYTHDRSSSFPRGLPLCTYFSMVWADKTVFWEDEKKHSPFSIWILEILIYLYDIKYEIF